MYKTYPITPKPSVIPGPRRLVTDPPKNPAIANTPYRTELAVSVSALEGRKGKSITSSKTTNKL